MSQRPFLPRGLRRAAAGVGLASLLAAACASRSKVAIQSFTLDPPPPRTIPAGAPVVSLAPIRVAAPYSGMSFVYRLGAHQIERDPYALWASPPAGLLTAAVRGYLRDAGIDVVAPAGDYRARAAIDMSVPELFAEISGPEANVVLLVHARVLAPADGVTAARQLLEKDYARRLASPKDAASLANAWNRGLAEIMADFVADLKPVISKAEPNPGP